MAQGRCLADSSLSTPHPLPFMASLLLLSFLIVLSSLPTSSLSPPVPITLIGGGSSLAFPLYHEAILAYELQYPSTSPPLNLSYTSSSSGSGRASLLAGQYDFADSDSILPPSFWAAQPNSLCLPALAAAVVPIFTLPGITQLHITKVALASIFMAQIIWWNDTAIISTNPGITLPEERITVVVRSDSSGTTHIFTDALSNFYPPFNATVGSAELVNFPIPAAYLRTGQGNEGVANLVVAIPYSIGYSVLYEAVQRQISYAAVQNTAGEFVLASTENVQFALYEKAVLTLGSNSSQVLPSNAGNSISLVNPSSPRAYPIAGFSYLIVLANTTRAGQTCAARSALVDFIIWFLYSDVSASLASLSHFNTLPDLLRTALNLETVVTTSVLCTDGELASGSVSAVVTNAGVGAMAVQNVFQLVATSYDSIAGTSFTYSATSTWEGFESIVNSSASGVTTPNYVAVIDAQLDTTSIQELEQNHNPSLISLPFALLPVAPVFNLPSIASIQLDVLTIGAMYAGSIITWDDPSIVALNPNVNLPSLPIILSSATPNTTANLEATAVFVQTLFRLSPPFTACFAQPTGQLRSSFVFSVQALPSCTTFNRTRWVYAASEGSLQGVVEQTSGSIGFSSIENSIQAQLVNLQTGSNVSLSFNLNQLSNCLINGAYTVDASTGAVSVNPSIAGSHCWPFVSTVSIVVASSYSPSSPTISCDTAIELFNFLSYVYMQPIMESDALFYGLYLVSSSTSAASDVAKYMNDAWTCDGQSIFLLPTPQGSSLPFSQNSSLVCVAILLCVVGAWVAVLLAELVVLYLRIALSRTGRLEENSMSSSVRAAPDKTRMSVFSRTINLIRSFWSNPHSPRFTSYLWLLLTAVCLSITSCWTTLVVSFASISLSCAACAQDLTIRFDLGMILLALAPALLPMYIGLLLVHKSMSSSLVPSVVHPLTKEAISSTSHLIQKAEAADKEKEEGEAVGWMGHLKEGFAHLWNLRGAVTPLFLLGTAISSGSIVLVRWAVLQSVQTYANIDDDHVSMIITAVLLVWPLLSLSLLIYFHATRWRIIGALLYTLAVVLHHQIQLNVMTVFYDDSSFLSSSSLHTFSISSTVLVLIASLLGAISVLLFIYLQFSKLQLSHSQLSRTLNILKRQLNKAEERHRSDAKKYNRLYKHVLALDQALEAVNLSRPLASTPAFLSKSSNIREGVEDESTDIDNNFQSFVSHLRPHQPASSSQTSPKAEPDLPNTGLLRAAVQCREEKNRSNTLAAPSRASGLLESSGTKSRMIDPVSYEEDLQILSPRLAVPYQPSLRAVLSHPVTAELLKDVAHSLHSVENVLFLIHYARYCELTDEEEKKRRAAFLVNYFIQDDAPMQVNLSSAQRVGRSLPPSDPSNISQFHSLLAEAEREVIQLVLTNVWKPFVRSPAYGVCGRLLESTAEEMPQVIGGGGKADGIKWNVSGHQQKLSMSRGVKEGKVGKGREKLEESKEKEPLSPSHGGTSVKSQSNNSD